MALVKAQGEQAAALANSNGGGASFTDVKLAVPKGGAVKVRILGKKANAAWDAHGLFGPPKLVTRPCITALGEDCPDCEATKAMYAATEKGSKEREAYGGMRKQVRYLIAFGVLETGEVGVFDASQAQFNALWPKIVEYATPDEDGDIAIEKYAFNFSRTNGDKTTYSLDLLPKMSKADQESFAKFEGTTLPDDYFEKILLGMVRDRPTMIDDLKKAGLDFGVFGGATNSQPTDESAPIVDGSVDPTDNF